MYCYYITFVLGCVHRKFEMSIASVPNSRFVFSASNVRAGNRKVCQIIKNRTQ